MLPLTYPRDVSYVALGNTGRHHAPKSWSSMALTKAVKTPTASVDDIKLQTSKNGSKEFDEFSAITEATELKIQPNFLETGKIMNFCVEA